MDGRFLDYRVCTTKSPETRSEERRRRREKALPSAVFAAKENKKQTNASELGCCNMAN